LKQALAQLKRQALHARLLGFVHPATGKNLTFSAPMPKDMQQVVDALQMPQNA
jgi:23S rRNA pseudouridine1911/1915/1917 synthase